MDFVLNGVQDLLRETGVVLLIGKSDHSAFKFSAHVNGKLPPKSKTVTNPLESSEKVDKHVDNGDLVDIMCGDLKCISPMAS